MKTDQIAAAPPSPWIPETNPVRCAVLGKSVKELSELAGIVGRCQIQGIEGCEPVSGVTNLASLEDEIADVEALIEHLKIEFRLSHVRIRLRRQRKFDYLNAWLDMLR